MVNSTARFSIRLPCSGSRILSPWTTALNSVGSARRLTTTSTSIAEQAPIAASSSSTGVKSVSVSPPEPTVSVPPRTL